MKRRIFCFVTVILLMLSVSANVFAADTANNNESASDFFDLNTSNLGPTSSLQLMFAKLQLQLSETAKKQALEMMDQIAKIQEEQKLVFNFLNTARQLQSESKENQDQTSHMPDDMYAYLKENNLVYDKTDDIMIYTAEEWEAVIGLLENHLEKLGTDTQLQMIYIQDFMRQYNSYLQGANTQTSNPNNTLTNLAKGQSMYGDSDVGLVVTALVVGLVLGCVITLAVQKVRRKKSVE